jgi:catechol 2,3-dioxygenase-like lactoylglutathione lyase family enzyme
MPSPIIALDHLRISVANLSESQNDYEHLTGLPASWTGIVDKRKAALFRTDNVTLLLLETAAPKGLDQICFRVDSLERMRRRLQRVAISCKEAATHDPIALAEGGTGTPLRLDIASADQSRGLSLAFTDRPTAPPAPVAGSAPIITGLDHVVIGSGDAQATAFLLAAQLGLDLRMDMSRPEWDARLMFFRCGDLIIEVFQRLSKSPEATEDSFYGLSWRIDDAEAAHRQLLDEGFDVSDVRKGRRPGTRVISVRNRTACVSTLLLEHSAP